MEIKETFTHCNKCPHKVTVKNRASENTNWYCGKTTDMYTATKNKNIAYLKRDGELIPTPTWCPLKVKSNEKYSAFATKSKVDDYKPTYSESWEDKAKKWNNLHHTCSWDDVKVDEIYHVPPINGEKRMDIIITSKTSYNIGYKTITKNGVAITTYNSFYKTSPQINFLVKHKLINFKSKNK